MPLHLVEGKFWGRRGSGGSSFEFFHYTAFIAGGEDGNGVVSCHTGKGSSAPAFFSLSAGSVGLQAGAEQAQILSLMNQEGEQQLMNGKFDLSANLVSEGPTGSNYTASAWKALVLSYEISHGAYGGSTFKARRWKSITAQCTMYTVRIIQRITC